jgi:hypothetical protein
VSPRFAPSTQALRPRALDRPIRCRSSVVEHSLGKGEVLSSILSGSTSDIGPYCTKSIVPVGANLCGTCKQHHPISDTNLALGARLLQQLGRLQDGDQARHNFAARRFGECPLLGVKRTSLTHAPMSAFDPKRTSPDTTRLIEGSARRISPGGPLVS